MLKQYLSSCRNRLFIRPLCAQTEIVIHSQFSRHLCSRPHSHESVIFSNFWDSYFSSYGEFGEFSFRFTAAL